MNDIEAKDEKFLTSDTAQDVHESSNPSNESLSRLDGARRMSHLFFADVTIC